MKRVKSCLPWNMLASRRAVSDTILQEDFWAVDVRNSNTNGIERNAECMIFPGLDLIRQILIEGERKLVFPFKLENYRQRCKRFAQNLLPTLDEL